MNDNPVQLERIIIGFYVLDGERPLMEKSGWMATVMTPYKKMSDVSVCFGICRIRESFHLDPLWEQETDDIVHS